MNQDGFNKLNHTQNAEASIEKPAMKRPASFCHPVDLIPILVGKAVNSALAGCIVQEVKKGIPASFRRKPEPRDANLLDSGLRRNDKIVPNS